MQHIHVDIETRSAVNLKTAGLHKYADDPDTEVLCVCWWVQGDKEINSWVPGETVPDWGEYIMVAHNAAFERAFFEKKLSKVGFRLPVSYICTMAKCAINGYPLALANAAKAMHLPVDKGSRMVMYRMCKPLKEGVDIESDEYLDDLDALVEYCMQDVRVEAELDQRLTISTFEQRVYEADQRINDRGVPLDLESVAKIIDAIDAKNGLLVEELASITPEGINTPGQTVKIVEWMKENDILIPDMRAETIQLWMYMDPTLTNLVEGSVARRVLEIRQATALSSLKKYPAMIKSASADHRARGLFQYCGAFSSGRWAGRRIQLQNLPRLEDWTDDDVNLALKLIHRGDIPALEMLLGDLFTVAKRLLRPMIHSDRGLVVGDWSSIELRFAAWLAGQTNLLTEILAQDLDPNLPGAYEYQASAIFGKPVADVTKQERAIGKATVLGCGYQMGAATFFKTTSRYGLDMTEELAQKSVDVYREKNHKIREIWYTLGDMALLAFDTGEVQPVGDKLKFCYSGKRKTLGLKLPSGRVIQYHDVEANEGAYGRELSCSSFSPSGNERKKLYGGLFFENACQGAARDLLAEAIVTCDIKGLEIIAGVHDELVQEGTHDTEPLKQIMETLPTWADGLPVKAEVFNCDGTNGRYTK